MWTRLKSECVCGGEGGVLTVIPLVFRKPLGSKMRAHFTIHHSNPDFFDKRRDRSNPNEEQHGLLRLVLR